MLCLEVAVNGRHHCLAGVGEGSLSAFVSHVRLENDPEAGPGPTESTFLTVSGFLSYQTAVHWGNITDRLAVGDTVTIRIVEREQPDPHTVTPLNPPPES